MVVFKDKGHSTHLRWGFKWGNECGGVSATLKGAERLEKRLDVFRWDFYFCSSSRSWIRLKIAVI